MMFESIYVKLILRLVVASLCGIVIGYERKSHAKAAGVRTHAVVACASALMMILSKYAYMDVIEMGIYEGAVKIDPSRIASGVVSGVGFLGAGLIFVNKQTVTGLTTAAGIWATSGIGMAIGAGLYVVGVSAAILLLLLQVLLHAFPMTNKHHDASQANLLHQALMELEAQISKHMEDGNNATAYTISVTASKADGEPVNIAQKTTV